MISICQALLNDELTLGTNGLDAAGHATDVVEIVDSERGLEILRVLNEVFDSLEFAAAEGTIPALIC